MPAVEVGAFSCTVWEVMRVVRATPQVVVRRSARRKRTVTAYREQDTIVVLVPERMTRSDEQRYVQEMVDKVLAREARSAAPVTDRALAERAAALVEQYLAPHAGQLRPLSSVVWVTNQSQRWGSCTPSTGSIRLSHRLQAVPLWVVDYVLLHELAHLAEPAHSARFWSLVARYPLAERAKGYLEGYLAGQRRPGGPDVLGPDPLRSGPPEQAEAGDGVD